MPVAIEWYLVLMVKHMPYECTIHKNICFVVFGMMKIVEIRNANRMGLRRTVESTPMVHTFNYNYNGVHLLSIILILENLLSTGHTMLSKFDIFML